MDSAGVIWVGTKDAGVAKLDSNGWTVYGTYNSGLPDNELRGISVDHFVIRRFATYGGCLAKFDTGNNWLVYNTSNGLLPTNLLNSLMIDKAGNKWIGTDGGGLVKFEDVNWIVYNSSNSNLPDDIILSIASDNSGNIWVGTDAGGVAKFDGVTWSHFNSYNSGLPDDRVFAITIDKNNHKWFGTKSGIGVYMGNATNTGFAEVQHQLSGIHVTVFLNPAKMYVTLLIETDHPTDRFGGKRSHEE